MSKKSHSQALRRAEEATISGVRNLVAPKFRQQYHFMPPQGWMNDPNGLIYFRGNYHFFYQYNPYGVLWDAMHWGHAISCDLIRWEHLPPALAPSESYDDFSKGGCFSGSAIEHENKLFLLYTGSASGPHGIVQTQCLASSDDGIHFTKYACNPVITAPKGYDGVNFRDPKVWRYQDLFYMVCGVSHHGRGQALLFRSKNLIDWDFVNVLAESVGELGSMWECPDFFQLGDQWVLTFSPMHAGVRKATYLMGDMDYRTGKFDYRCIGELDWGFDFYAPQSFSDYRGRRIIVAWANGWEWMPWFKNWGPTYSEGWCGTFCVPREVTLGEDKTLRLAPVREITALRSEPISMESLNVDEAMIPLPVPNPLAFDLELCFDLTQTTAEIVEIGLRAGGGKATLLQLDLKRGMLSLDRNKSDNMSCGVCECPLPLNGHSKLNIRILSDTQSLEVFALDGRVCLSANVFASDTQTGQWIVAKQGIAVLSSYVAYGLCMPADK